MLGFIKKKTPTKYEIQSIQLLYDECTDIKLVFLIDKDIIAYVEYQEDIQPSNKISSIDYTYDEKWLKQNNITLQEIHQDFCQKLSEILKEY